MGRRLWWVVWAVVSGVFGCQSIYVGHPKPCQRHDDCRVGQRCIESQCHKRASEPYFAPPGESETRQNARLHDGGKEGVSTPEKPEGKKELIPKKEQPEPTPELKPEPRSDRPASLHINRVTPPSVFVGDRVTLTLIGIGFSRQARVLFETSPLTTTYIKPTELQAEINLRRVAHGKYFLYVENPTGQRAPIRLIVLQREFPPILRVLNPPQGTTGTKVAFCAHGTGFPEGSVILFHGKPIPSKRIRRDQICAAPSLDLTNVPPGQYDIAIKSTCGDTSNKETFVVKAIHPTPKFDRILPFVLTLGKGKQTLGIWGQDFARGATLRIGSHTLHTSQIQYKSDSFFSAQVDMSKSHWKAGNFKAVVLNPKGKHSNEQMLSITKPSAP